MKTRTLYALCTPLVALALVACSSGSTPDSSADASTAAPTPSQTAEASGDANATGSDFCSSLDGLDGIDADLLAASGRLNTATEDAEKWGDPATLTALHDNGQAMLDEIPDVVTYYEATASQVDDPEVSAAVLAMGDLYGVYYAALGQSAVDAPDVMSYFVDVLDISGNETLSQVMSDATDAAYAVADYTSAHCSGL